MEYEVAVTVEDRPYTQKQVDSTFKRYKDLNHRNAMLKPIHNVIENYLRSNPNESIDGVAQKLAALAAGGEPEPTFGGQGPEANNIPDPATATATGNQSNVDVSAALKEWADKNALDGLPPGIEQMLANQTDVGAINGRMAQMENILGQILPTLQGGMDAVAAQNAGNISAADQNRQQLIANNIDKSQAALNIPDDRAPDFETWIQMMGLTLEDFIDPEDAIKYMSAFDRDIKGQQYEGLKSMTEKRLAYTGTLGSTPSTPTPTMNPEEGRFNALSDKIMAQKGLV